MQYNQLITDIQADIYSNGAELITGDILQNVLVAMVGALSSAGACYKGTITPASAAPADLDQATVYLALTAGTYTNFVDSNNDPIVTTGPALITYDGGASLVFSKTDLPSGGSSATVIDTTGKNYLVFDWGAQNLGGSLLVTLKTSSGNRNRSLILDLDVYGDYVAKASDLDGAVELLNDTDFVYDNGTGVGYLTINSDVKGATLRLLSGTLPAISAESSAPEYYDPASVPVAPYGDGKWGVISQVQTWTQDADGGYHYDMSHLQYGAIPQANIDLFVAAGAVFNAVSGYFELNGLTDISYEEMKKIYAISFPRVRQFYLSAAFASSTARTNFCIFDFTELLGQSAFGSVATPSINLAGLASFSLTEKISYTRSLSMTAAVQIEKKCDSIQRMCSDAIYLREVEGVVQVQNISSLYRAFYHAYSLETIYLYKLKADVNLADSSLLSKDSLLYMINNEAATSAITITLHASVYAKTQSGGEWYSDINTALSAHTNVSLQSA